jgi:hypothetical protein
MKKAVVLSLIAALAGAAYAQTPLRIKNLKVLCVIYRAPEGDKQRLDDKTVTQIKNGFELGRLFYFRNSQARLNTQLEWMLVDTVAPDQSGSSIDNIVADLRKRGVKDGDIDGLIVTGVGMSGNLGGFNVFGGAGACFGGGGTSTDMSSYPAADPNTGYGSGWIFVHEFQHALELVITAGSGLKLLSAHPYSDYMHPQFKGNYQGGEHWDWIALTFREFDDWLQIKGMRNDFLEVKDADGDGLPDDDPRLPMDEKRFGSDPTKKDTDGDGLDDLGEFIADRYAGSDPKNPDTDGDGLKDSEDPYPLVAISATLAYKGTPGAKQPFINSVFARNDKGGDAPVYAEWDEDALYFEYRGPRKFAVEAKIDGSARNGFWEGGDTYLLRIADGKVSFAGMGLGEGPVPGATATGKADGDKYVLTAKIPAKLGQGVSKEINYGGKRDPGDVADGLTLVPGRAVSFNFIYDFGDQTRAVLTPHHTMYATRLVKPGDLPDKPLLRGPAITRDNPIVVNVLGVKPDQKVQVVAGGKTVGVRVGSGPVQVVGLEKDAEYELQAQTPDAKSNAVKTKVDRTAAPPRLEVKAAALSATCEPNAEFELWWGINGVPAAPLSGAQADDKGAATLKLDDGLLKGWTVTGFDGSRFQRQVYVEGWDKIDKSFEGGPPDKRMNWDFFSYRFAGLLKIDKPGRYTFELSSDDGSRLWIDGEIVVDHWGHHGESPKTGTAELTAGLHPVRIDYYEEDGWAGIHIRYAPPGGALTADVPVLRAPLPLAEVELAGVQVDPLGNRSAFSPAVKAPK